MNEHHMTQGTGLSRITPELEIKKKSHNLGALPIASDNSCRKLSEELLDCGISEVSVSEAHERRSGVVSLPSDINVAPTAFPIKINGTQECLSYLTGERISVYQIDKTSGTHVIPMYSRTFGKIPIMAEILGRSNIIAMVFSADPYVLAIWDDKQGQIVKELTMDYPIVNAYFQGEFLLLITMQTVVLYRFRDFQIIMNHYTGMNPLGLGCLHNGSNFLLALPTSEKNLGEINLIKSSSHSSFQAHQSPLSAIRFSPDGRLIATASQRGTIIRLWNTEEHTMIQEFRRGVEATMIRSLEFNMQNNLLAVCGHTSTVHLYCLGDLVASAAKKPTFSTSKTSNYFKQALRMASKELPNYLNSQGSLIQINTVKDTLAIFLGYSQEILLINPSGQLYKFQYQLEPPGSRQVLFMQLE